MKCRMDALCSTVPCSIPVEIDSALSPRASIREQRSRPRLPSEVYACCCFARIKWHFVCQLSIGISAADMQGRASRRPWPNPPDFEVSVGLPVHGPQDLPGFESNFDLLDGERARAMDVESGLAAAVVNALLFKHVRGAGSPV